MLNIIKTILLFSLSLTCIANYPTDELTASEIEAVSQMKQVVHLEEVKGFKWPRVTLYQKINATPLESVAVFYAVEHQKNYIPNITKAKVVKQEIPTHTDVEYVMHMPWPLSDSNYTHSHYLTYDKVLGYKVKWNMKKSSSANKVDGSAEFTNFNGATIMKYRSLIDPKSSLAKFLKSTMVNGVKESMKVTKEEIEKIKKLNRKQMYSFVKMIDSALNGIYPYIQK